MLTAQPQRSNDIVELNVETHVYRLRSSGFKLLSATTLLDNFGFNTFDADLILNRHYKTMCLKPEYFGMSKDEIKQAWKDAAKLGTQLHLVIENTFNGQDLNWTFNDRDHDPCLAQFKDFVSQHCKILTPQFGVELRVFNEYLGNLINASNLII